ncbi:ATP-dependent DNA ligase [Asanoa ferruginea]|uniref:DNA ligase (ATP) n=1 Tax=Asanoa ferruginea TaxID=53367 RepID=A0A3D9ZL38_9ACTN|nr:ATP-dependent DNA ligase [Asanoa ferruginea]REF98088.1 ATP-dependent DNA ligase [Asanoa ferruginea]GIF49618.1 ATP-dependent DNA ligase [Asanoa ferruginea]
MDLPINPPVEPMLAKSVPQIPEADGMSYEPKWDGFRCIIFRDGDEVELASRGGKTLTRYFPEVVEQAKAQLPERCAVDGEIVVIHREPGQQPKLEWDWLTQRIHPAASRVKLLAENTPADFVAFDLLALGDEVLVDEPYATRRAKLEKALARVKPPVHLTPTTHDIDTARRWFEIFEGAGLDGLIAKPADIAYEPNKRLMFKIKHARTADAVVAGFRWHKSGPVVGSLLLGLYDEHGTLHHIGVSSSFSMARRAELLDELADYREPTEHPWIDADSDEQQMGPTTASGQRRPGGVSRWTGGKNLAWEPLRPDLVVEVGYDAMEGDRFRHTAQFVRWRPDRDPRSCGYDQLDRPVRFDVDQVLGGDPAAGTGVS